MTRRIDEQKASAEEISETIRVGRSLKGIGVGLLTLIAIGAAGWATFLLQ